MLIHSQMLKYKQKECLQRRIEITYVRIIVLSVLRNGYTTAFFPFLPLPFSSPLTYSSFFVYPRLHRIRTSTYM